jgi:hypothetical protein
MGVPDGATSVEFAPDLEATRALYDFDGVVVDMNRVLNRHNLVPPTSFIEQKRFEAEHLLAKGGIIVCLLQPLVAIKFMELYADSYGWIPVNRFGSVVTSNEGMRITKVAQSPFDDYLDVKGTIWRAFLNKSALIAYETLANNDAGFAVAARLRSSKGRIYFLPFNLNKEEALPILLRCLERAWKSEVERPQPEWLKTVAVPNEVEITKQIVEVGVKIRELADTGEKLSLLLAKKLELKKLLYEQGPSLEEAVKVAFEELGFSLQKEGDKDLVFRSPAERVIFEVTGSDGTIGLGKLRQLFDFISKEKQPGTAVKGILVGNQEVDVSPAKRGVAFTQHVIDRANEMGVCLLPTTELFRALVLFRQKKLEPVRFWISLTKTTGIFELKQV